MKITSSNLLNSLRKGKNSLNRIVYICLFVVFPVFSQKIEVKGRFLADTMQLGQRVSYVLEVRFPYDVQVLMPDSTSDYGGFKLLGIKTFNSRLENNIQMDSVLYELISFGLDSIQYLRLPIYKYEAGDSTIYHSNKDSILLIKPKIGTGLQEDLRHATLNYKFNYQVWLASILAALVAIYTLARVYTQRVKRMYLKIAQKRRFKIYIKNHNEMLKTFQQAHDVGTLEKIVGNWKDIMSDISQKPVSTYTAKEINHIYKDQKLYEALQNIDRAIYSGAFSDQLYVDIEIIYNKSKLEFFKQSKNKSNE